MTRTGRETDHLQLQEPKYEISENIRRRRLSGLAAGEPRPGPGSSPEPGLKEIFRAWRVKVFVDPVTEEIDEVKIGGQILPMGPGVNVSGKNMTEPMLTRDGRFLFWASNNFIGTQARYIGPVSACTQLNQSSTPYSQLPSGRFPWVDQYTFPVPSHATSRTNYHHVLERPQNGTTALLFEKCSAQQNVSCDDDPTSRYCDCKPKYENISTTGFTPGLEPEEITNCCGAELNKPPDWRETHPAVSGDLNADGSWLLFFKRGKKIWFTKISEMPH